MSKPEPESKPESKPEYKPEYKPETKCLYCDSDLDRGDIYQCLRLKYDDATALEYAAKYGWSETNKIHFNRSIIVQPEQGEQYLVCPDCNGRQYSCQEIATMIETSPHPPPPSRDSKSPDGKLISRIAGLLPLTFSSDREELVRWFLIAMRDQRRDYGANKIFKRREYEGPMVPQV